MSLEWLKAFCSQRNFTSLKLTENICLHQNPFRQMFITSIVLSTKTQKQLRCLSLEEWINKWYYIQTVFRLVSTQMCESLKTSDPDNRILSI